MLNFSFQNVKLPYESYKGDYATIKYYIKIIIIATYKNAEYEQEFAVVNPYDSSILQKNDEPIHMKVGMKQKLSLSIYFQHKNYNCRGTLKGFILFNYINLNIKFMEVQIVRREVIFGDKNCEPAYVARYELIDGVPIKNERIPIRFFLKSYNLTPSYPNIDNVFCVRYFLNLVIADDEDNRYFKQKEICLFRLYKERRNFLYNYNNNYNNDGYNNDEIFITEPIYEEDYSLDYQPAFNGPMNNNNPQNNYNNNDDYLNYGVNPNLPSINEDESYDFGYNNINNYNNNDSRNNNNNYNNNNRINNNYYNRNNTFSNNNRRNNYNSNDNNEDYFDNRNNRGNNINNYNDNFNQNNNDRNNNYNRNNTYNNKRNNNNIFEDNDNYDNNNNYNNYEDNYNDNYNNDINNRNNRNNKSNINYINDNDNINRNQNNRNRQNNYNQNRKNNNNNRGNNDFLFNNPSSYHSIKTNNNSYTYNSNMFNDDINNDDTNNNIIDTNSNNYHSGNFINNDNDNSMHPLEKKSSNTHRSNLMQTRISSEDDFKNIFNSLDKNKNKEELKKNIFG